MNFLLHRHLAARALGTHAAGHGAMLPDLWRMADRRVRATSDATPATPAAVDGTGAVDGEVAAGIAHHLAADTWFHRSALFKEGEQAARERFRAAELVAPRMGLLAHAAWELCLDGALLRREGLAATLDTLRAGHDALGSGPSGRAAARHHFDRVARSDGERAAFTSRMREIVERLLDGRWVGAYAHGPGLALIVGGMRRRLGLVAMGERDHALLAMAMAAMLERAEARLPELLREAP